MNGNNVPYQSWNWKAGQQVLVQLMVGTINNSTVSANTTAGFSIVKYKGMEEQSTIPHHLGTTPNFILNKNL